MLIKQFNPATEAVESLPAQPGTYLLHLEAVRDVNIEIGRLGPHNIRSGHYLYVGSAQGSGGLRGRLRRQVIPTGRRHWHIDTLRAALHLRRIWFHVGSPNVECFWSECIAAMADDPRPVPGFGATDCFCPTHLFFFMAPPPLDERLLSPQ